MKQSVVLLTVALLLLASVPSFGDDSGQGCLVAISLADGNPVFVDGTYTGDTPCSVMLKPVAVVSVGCHYYLYS